MVVAPLPHPSTSLLMSFTRGRSQMPLKSGLPSARRGMFFATAAWPAAGAAAETRAAHTTTITTIAATIDGTIGETSRMFIGRSPCWSAHSPLGFHALLPDHGRGRWSRQKFDQRGSGAGLFRPNAHASDTDRVLLNLLGELAEQFDSLHRKNFADR